MKNFLTQWKTEEKNQKAGGNVPLIDKEHCSDVLLIDGKHNGDVLLMDKKLAELEDDTKYVSIPKFTKLENDAKYASLPKANRIGEKTF